MREPHTPTEDLVKAIVDAFKPWREEYKNSETEIQAAVRERVELLRSVMPKYFGRTSNRQTRADARKIAATAGSFKTRSRPPRQNSANT